MTNILKADNSMLGNKTAPLVSTVKRRRTKGKMIKNVQISKQVN